MPNSIGAALEEPEKLRSLCNRCRSHAPARAPLCRRSHACGCIPYTRDDHCCWAGLPVLAELLVLAIALSKISHHLISVQLTAIFRHPSIAFASYSQAALRGMDQRLYTRQLLDQVRSQQSMAGYGHAYGTNQEQVEFSAAQSLQAVWRAHLARQFVEKLRYKMTAAAHLFVDRRKRWQVEQ